MRLDLDGLAYACIPLFARVVTSWVLATRALSIRVEKGKGFFIYQISFTCVASVISNAMSIVRMGITSDLLQS